jgi:hypothetical protein
MLVFNSKDDAGEYISQDDDDLFLLIGTNINHKSYRSTFSKKDK